MGWHIDGELASIQYRKKNNFESIEIIRFEAGKGGAFGYLSIVLMGFQQWSYSLSPQSKSCYINKCTLAFLNSNNNAHWMNSPI